MVALLSGGYNKGFFDEDLITAGRSAKAIVPHLIELLDPSSVIDVGCGTGSWLYEFAERGVDVRGVDNASLYNAQLQIPRDKVYGHDLTKPFKLDRQFDLVSCLEVAEHLPHSCSEQIVENLTALGPVVLFSAAIPHQGGINHINEQWPEYWVERFAARGYRVVDCIRERIWKDENVAYWYAQNLLLYVKESHLESMPQLAGYAANTNPKRVTVVHPKTYVKNASALKKPHFMAMRFIWNNIPRAIRMRLVKPLDAYIWKQVSTKYSSNDQRA